MRADLCGSGRQGHYCTFAAVEGRETTAPLRDLWPGNDNYFRVRMFILGRNSSVAQCYKQWL